MKKFVVIIFKMPLKNTLNFTITTKELEDFLTEVDATPVTKVAEVNQERLEAVEAAFNELLEYLWEEEFISAGPLIILKLSCGEM